MYNLSNFGTEIGQIGVFFIIMLIAMLPVVECRGAIPLGVSSELWGENALNILQSFLASIIGSCVVVIILSIIYIPIKNFLFKSKIFCNMHKILNEKMLKIIVKFNKFFQKSKTKKVDSKSSKFRLPLFLILFTALPIPGSGVWSASILGRVLGVSIWNCIWSICLGNIMAALFVAFLSAIFIDYILLVLVSLAIIFVMYILYKLLELVVHIYENKKILK